jgi:hypothetical protein
VIDAHGSTSLQQDIVIYDNTVGTVFEVSSIKYFPCESVIAVGEVKARMDSSDKLDDALNKIFSAKNLDRSNSGRNELVTGPGISLDVLPFKPNDNYRDQIFGFIFTGKSMQRDSTLRKLQEFNQKKDPRVWPNLFCDDTKMLISYEVEGGLVPDPMTAKCLYCTEDSEIDDLLLLFYCILSSFVNRAHVARPNYFHYASMETSKATYHSLKGG